MAVGLSLPEDAQWVSEICLDKNVLSIRLVPVVIDANLPCAYVLNVHEVADPASAITFLKKICNSDQDDYVYVYLRDGNLVIALEGGDKLILRTLKFSTQVVDLTVAEFRKELQFYKKLLENSNNHVVALTTKLNAVTGYLVEQARRIDIKAASHNPQSTVSTLYKQQQSLIERVLKITLDRS
jgi:hypothetical protein